MDKIETDTTQDEELKQEYEEAAARALHDEEQERQKQNTQDHSMYIDGL